MAVEFDRIEPILSRRCRALGAVLGLEAAELMSIDVLRLYHVSPNLARVSQGIIYWAAASADAAAAYVSCQHTPS